MKYSVYEPPYYCVALDGSPIFVVQFADDEAGIVIAPLLAADGRAVFDHSRDDFALVERRGDVRIGPVSPSHYPGYPTPIAETYPFHVATAREGELGADYDKVRISGKTG